MNYCDLSIKEFCRVLASAESGPGGGSAAALNGAIGAGLVEMALGKTGQEENPIHSTARERLRHLHETLLKLMDEDSLAFAEVSQRMEGNGQKKSGISIEEWNHAVENAIEVPLAIADCCLGVLAEAQECIPSIAQNMLSELTVAAAALQGAIIGAAVTAEANVPLLEIEDKQSEYRHKIKICRLQGAKRATKIIEASKKQ